MNMIWTLNRRMQSTEKGIVFGVGLPEEKILEWNVEGQMLITHTEERVKGHYTEGKEWIKSWNQNA